MNNQSFTLVELLIVIGILAILTAAVVVVINPAELLQQSRDSKRVQDLTSLDSALQISESLYPDISLGNASTVYVSIADTSATCANLGLPTLPAGWVYNCVTATNLTNADGTGWIPVNFQDSNLAGSVQVAALPVDPTNTTSTGLFYTYSPGGSWEFNAILESDKYRLTADDDGGDSYSVYETGTSKTLLPYSDSGLLGYWDFENGSGTTAKDKSGNDNHGTLTNSPTWTDGKVGEYALSFGGSNEYVDVGDVSELDVGTSDFTTMAWVKTSNSDTSQYVFLKRGAGTAGYLTWVFSNGKMQTRIGDGTNDALMYSGSVVADGAWHLLTSVYDRSGNLTIYVDGVQDGTPTSLASIGNADSTGSFSISRSSLAFDGQIDDVRIYDHALSLAEILAIYNASR